MLNTVKISLPWLIGVEFEFNIQRNTKKIAWELYCELSTRVGVIDYLEEEDIIISCLRSWYTFFLMARDKLKSMDPPKRHRSLLKTKKRIKNGSGKKGKKYSLSEVIIALLNDQLRPFLRKWHGVFKFYWESDHNKEILLIERQKAFPDYDILINELKAMSEKLRQTKDALYIIAAS